MAGTPIIPFGIPIPAVLVTTEVMTLVDVTTAVDVSTFVLVMITTLTGVLVFPEAAVVDRDTAGDEMLGRADCCAPFFGDPDLLGEAD